MNKEQIQKRLDELTKSKEQLAQNLLAHEGAIQDCKFWLQELNNKEPDGETNTD